MQNFSYKFESVKFEMTVIIIILVITTIIIIILQTIYV